jgi:hypothetical protein
MSYSKMNYFKAAMFAVYGVIFWYLWYSVYKRPEDARSYFILLRSTGPLGLLFYMSLSWSPLRELLPSLFLRAVILYVISVFQWFVLCPALVRIPWRSIVRWWRGGRVKMET